MSHICVVCNQPWPEEPYRPAKEQQRRITAACDAHSGIEGETRNVEHLLYAALKVLNNQEDDGTTEEHRRWVVSTLLEYAQSACEELQESTEALWGVTSSYLWPTHPRAKEAMQRVAAEEETGTAKEEG